MGKNSHPGFTSPTFTIEGRPEEHEATIRRQGQLVRLIQAKICPCVKNGKSNLHHQLCNGKGYLHEFQKEIRVIEENSPHPCSVSVGTLKPYWTRIARVDKVMKIDHPACGGNVSYEVESFTDDEILLKFNGSDFPLPYEMLKVTYWYNNYNKVTDENSTSDGTYIIHTTGTEVDVLQRNSNPFEVHGDIVSVSRVYNVTQDITYTVTSFSKQSIVLDDGDTAPIVTDVLEVDYEYVDPAKIGVGKIDMKNALIKWGENLKQGDLECVLKAGYQIKRGDIASLLTTFIDESTVIQRGVGTKDELPHFDVDSIIGNIIDEDGTEYINGTDFKLAEYNDLIWIGTTPAQGKRFTIVYQYHPSYIVYNKDFGKLNAEDKQFPQSLLLRKFEKYGTKELRILS